MDWYSWLSKTALDPSLVHDYGLSFSHNQLEKDDLAHFNHQFLQSMGVSVAKHRLEILKLARKEVGEPSNSQSKLISAINKTIKCFNRYVNKLVHHGMIEPLLESVRYRGRWRGDLTRKCKNEKKVNIEQPVARICRKVAKSGPLDYKEQEKKLLAPPRRLKLSGPIEVAVAQERLKFSANLNYVRPPSPKIHGDHYNREKASGNYGDQTLWAAMFQDMKPT